MNLMPKTIVSGRYEIVERLGMGGMAVVYKAMDNKLNRFVTLKVMREEYITDDEFIKRFNIEAKAAASLSHPNIVSVFDVGQDGNVNYIVMEFIDGVTLKQLIRTKAPFHDDEIIGVALQIASGLSHAHKNGVIHRDIKPQNIMVTMEGEVKVTDFGIARAVGSSTITTGTSTMGSVHYISPEQARGVFVDHKSDLYSLGIVMYEMTTGRIPFDGDTAVTIALKQVNDPIPNITDYNREVSISLEKIVRKSTEKSLTMRYQSAEEMIIDLRKALTDASGRFVQDKATDSPTIRFTSEDLATIKGESRDVSEERYSRYYDNEDDYSDYNQEKYRKGNNKSNAKNRQNNNHLNKYDKYDDGSMEKKIVIAGIVTGIALIALISAIVAFFVIKNRPVPIVVPSVEGQTITDATESLKELGLVLMAVEEVFDDNVEEGLIVSQDEEEGVELFAGDTVHVTVSKGSDKIPVPDLTLKDMASAESLAREVGLAVTEEKEFSEDVPISIIIRQDPLANDKVAKGSVITVYTSLGPAPSMVVVPDVEGISEARAIRLLEGAGLVIGLSSKSNSDTVPPGDIIKQTIKPGTEVSKGQEISYIISTGPIQKPSPSPEPTPDNASNTASTGTKKTAVLIIDPIIPEGAESIVLRVNKKTADKYESVFNEALTVDQFPYHLTVSGEGQVEFMFYISNQNGEDVYAGSKIIEFN